MPHRDRRPALYASYEHAALLVSGVSAHQLEAPTPCPAFNVSGLVDAAHGDDAMGGGLHRRGAG